ncbi:MAG TPA: two-component regulator propeller domain-containing protein [Bacteroidia bacterium]|nr:two-component regulator propeller domain-containing protein [Bacteroidia bacterium]
MKRSVAILITWLFVHPLFPQQLRFKQITSEEGLSTNFVKSILEDDKGFMWFGTQDGLNKYNGYEMRVFKNNPADSASIFCSDITALNQIREDIILVGTSEGLTSLNPVTERFTELSAAQAGFRTRVNAILRMDDQYALIGTQKGLYQYNYVTQKISRSYLPGQDINVRCLTKFNKLILVGTEDQGVWKLDGQKFSPVEFNIPEYSDFKAEDLRSVSSIRILNNMIYISTLGSGIFKADKYFEVDKNIVFKTDVSNVNYIRDFVIRNSKIVAATESGLLVYNQFSEEENFYQKKDQPLALNANRCNTILLDSQNNLWIGTEMGGVNISFFRSLKFPTSTRSIESQFENIYSFYELNRDRILLGGLGVLHEIDLQSGKVVSHQQLLQSVAALCIERESQNVVWVGSLGEGLYRYELDQKRGKRILGGETGGTIVCLRLEAPFLYAGSIGDGLFRIDLRTQEVMNYTTKQGLPSNNINSIFKDSGGKVWICTNDGGLVKLSGFGNGDKLPIEKIFNNTGKLGQIASNMVFGVNEDKRGNIWVASSTGLSKLLTNQSFYNFYEKDGLASTYLYSILRDSSGCFWMSSNSGIIKFDPKYSEKEITFKNYNIKDGLVNTEYNMGAAFASASGMMYFGGAKGFNAFRPMSIKDNLHVPNAYVIGYQRGGNDVVVDSLITYKRHLSLDWSENYFQFELTALDFTDPEKNKFRYKLEGMDKDWSAPTSVRYVSYTSLPGGDYVFKVKAANNDGVWNEKPFEIRITVIPPFWKTKTFYVLVLVIGLALIYGYTQYRTRAIKKENRILEGKVALRTKQLEEKNKDITSSIEYARRIQEAILPSKEQIFKKLRKIFILYQPKDIVSGDFYWFAEENNFKIFAVVDCTGHGVPGAFMSMIGHNLLHQIVLEKGVTDPGEILNNLHKGVQEALRQGQNEINTNDGMDVSIIAINDQTRDIRWAGANRPLVIIDKNNETVKLDGNKFPVGGAQLDKNREFNTRKVNPSTTAMAYMFSDGYADQFGGDRGKKFMVKRFHDLLTTIHHLPAEEQRLELKKNFENWRANHEQVDDVLVVGIEI